MLRTMTDVTSNGEPTQQWKTDLDAAREVLRSEADTLRSLSEQLDAAAFGRAVDLLFSCKAQIVVTGMGKSGHIAAKVAATLASTGTPAFFLHPGEALHGDLGMVTPVNVVLAFSQSGATEEVVSLLPYLKQLRVPIVAVTGSAKSVLAQHAACIVLSSVDAEACPLNLAPTNSTTAQLALGDALAIALMKRRGFTPDDFAMRHPLGSLGRRLLARVGDLMHTGDRIPMVSEDARLDQAIRELSRKRFGAVCAIDADGRLAGIFTEGDLGRLFNSVDGVLDIAQPISKFMIRSPKSISPELLGVKAVDLMETHKIMALPVLDADRRVVGFIHMHDLIRAGITP